MRPCLCEVSRVTPRRRTYAVPTKGVTASRCAVGSAYLPTLSASRWPGAKRRRPRKCQKTPHGRTSKQRRAAQTRPATPRTVTSSRDGPLLRSQSAQRRGGHVPSQCAIGDGWLQRSNRAAPQHRRRHRPLMPSASASTTTPRNPTRLNHRRCSLQGCHLHRTLRRHHRHRRLQIRQRRKVNSRRCAAAARARAAV